MVNYENVPERSRTCHREAGTTNAQPSAATPLPCPQPRTARDQDAHPRVTVFLTLAPQRCPRVPAGTRLHRFAYLGLNQQSLKPGLPEGCVMVTYVSVTASGHSPQRLGFYKREAASGRGSKTPPASSSKAFESQLLEKKGFPLGLWGVEGDESNTHTCAGPNPTAVTARPFTASALPCVSHQCNGRTGAGNLKLVVREAAQRMSLWDSDESQPQRDQKEGIPSKGSRQCPSLLGPVNKNHSGHTALQACTPRVGTPSREGCCCSTLLPFFAPGLSPRGSEK